MPPSKHALIKLIDPATVITALPPVMVFTIPKGRMAFTQEQTN